MELSTDVIGIVLSHLDVTDKLFFSRVCRTLRRQVATNLLKDVKDWWELVVDKTFDKDEEPEVDIFNDPFDNPETKHFFIDLSNENHVRQIVLLAGSALLLSPTIETLKQHIRIFPLACQYGLYDLVETFLKTFSLSEIQPSCFNNFSIRKASECGNVKIVSLLLQYPDIDPAADNQYAIRRSCCNGHLSTVKILLSRSEVNISIQNNYPIRIAATNSHVEVVRELLKYYDPTKNNCEAIIWASTLSSVEVMQALQEYPGFDVSCRYNYAIQWASRTGQLRMVKYLVTCPGVDPTVNKNYSVYWAERNGHSEVAQFLLTLPGVKIPEIFNGVEPGQKPIN